MAIFLNGGEYKPAHLYLCTDGFYINQTGIVNIVIEYEPQRWFFYGSLISASTFLICIVCLSYAYTKDRKFPHKSAR